MAAAGLAGLGRPAAEARAAAEPGREIHLVLENGANIASDIASDFDAQWNDDIHHVFHVLLTGESGGYYADYAEAPAERLARALREGFVYQGETSAHEGGPRGTPSGHLPPTAFVSFLQNHDQIGNRAFGERLSGLVAPERLSLARAIFLLAPQIPLLFMGEEWAASSPFQFFVDFENDPDLAKAVREGRRGEFAHFKAFADPEASQRIPDPTDRATFERSRIAWDEAGRPPHRDILSETGRLLGLRRTEIVPRIASAYRGSRQASSGNVLDVTWTFESGVLRSIANFGADGVSVTAGDTTRALWSSPGASLAGAQIQLGPWTGMILKGASA